MQAQGDLPGAAAAWKEVLATHPSDVEALVNLGIVASRHQRYPRSRGDRAFQSRHLNGATPVLEKVADPENRQAPSLLGFSYYGTRQFKQALPLLSELPEANTSAELRP